MTTMPTEITYGYVTARIILATGDGADPDRLPDAQPAKGTTVKITPKNQIVRLAGASPVLIAKQPITCTLDEEGRLLDPQGNLGVWLVTGVYTVTYSSPSAAIPAHNIEVTTAHTEASPLNLTTAMPPGGPVLTASQYAELSARIDALPTGGSGGGAVSSVNGKTGAVTLNAADVSALPSTYTPPAPSWSSVTGKPSTFTPSAHTHAVADVTGLQAALDGKQPAGSYAPTSHVHTIADVTGLQAALDTAGAPQTLSLTGQNLSLSGGGGTVTLPSGGGGGGGVDATVGVPNLGKSGWLLWNFRGFTTNIEFGAEGEVIFFRLVIGVTTPVTAVGFDVKTAGSTGALIRPTLYKGDGLGGGPGTRIADGGTVGATTTGWKTTATGTVTVPPGNLWVGLACQGGAATRPQVSGGNPPAHLQLPSPGDYLWPGGRAIGSMPAAAPATWTQALSIRGDPACPSAAITIGNSA